jgi:16S rRNA (guanine(966)-N(2))-methyltransferase RsmD
MRVIAGTSRGRRLTTFKGCDVRPTPDRIREAVFSILQSKLGNFIGLKVLDLFAGSGALAIEALSRGAASACLVEKASSSAEIIRDNLARCQLDDRAKLIVSDAFQVLKGFDTESFDLIFLDPPYGLGMAERSLVDIDRLKLLNKNGILCVETGKEETLPDSVGQLQRIDQRCYGSIMINLYS